MSLSENLSISETSESRGMTAVTEKTSLTEVAPAQQPRLKAARRAQWTSLPPDVLIPHEICHWDQGFLPHAPPPPHTAVLSNGLCPLCGLYPLSDHKPLE